MAKSRAGTARVRVIDDQVEILFQPENGDEPDAIALSPMNALHIANALLQAAKFIDCQSE